MIDPELRAQLERHWEYAGKDEDMVHESMRRTLFSRFLKGMSVTRAWRTSVSGADSTQQDSPSRSAG